LKYRPEIDGLRAIAVVPVVFFHAGFSVFNAGFIGVDIFFVISGFLITHILAKELTSNKYSLLSFYERRARRILPALVFVILVTLPFAWWQLLPGPMKDFSQSLIGVATFASNILFWREVGYFDTAAELKPLLHTWSLAIEEQYYVFFPLILAGVWRFGLKVVLLVCVSLFTVSLFMAHWGAYRAPSATFFLLHTRAWELLVGALIALYSLNSSANSKALQQPLSLIGLLLVLASYWIFDSNTPSPSLHMLMPTIGTGLILLFAHKGTMVQWLLSQSWMVGVGLISYSAYLWHQPLFALVRSNGDTHLSIPLALVLCILPFFLAYLTWKYIEAPFRNRHFLSQKQVFILSFAVLAGLATIGVVGHVKEGNVWRFSVDQMEVVGYKTPRDSYVWRQKKAIEKGEFAAAASFKLLVVGDSNSGDFINSLYTQTLADGVDIRSITMRSECGTLFLKPERLREFIHVQDHVKCTEQWQMTPQKMTLLQQADLIVLAAAWKDWQLPLLEASFAALTEIAGDQFIVFGTKHFNFNAKQLVQMSTSERHNSLLVPQQFDLKMNAELERLVGDRFMNPYSFFCGFKTCNLFSETNQILTFDGFHLTPAGAQKTGRFLAQDPRLSSLFN